eukprot:2991327-Pleurochrysis_carterae.AAC.1
MYLRPEWSHGACVNESFRKTAVSLLAGVLRLHLSCLFALRLAQDAIVAGGASGIAGAFQAPLGGIIFAIEEMGNRSADAFKQTRHVRRGRRVWGGRAVCARAFAPMTSSEDVRTSVARNPRM